MKVVRPREVEQVLRQLELPAVRDTPVEPSLYADFLHCEIRDVAAGSPQIEISKQRRTIRIPESLSGSERRFALAHELGHLCAFLGGVTDVQKDEPPSRMLRTRISRLERWCDTAARLMLIPSHQMSGHSVSRQPTIQEIIHLSRQFDVPMPAAFARMLDVRPGGPISMQLLLRYGRNLFTGRDEKWRVAHAAIPYGQPWISFPQPNSGIQRIGIAIPPPERLSSESQLNYPFVLAKQTFNLAIQQHATVRTWALGAISKVRDESLLF